MKWDKPRILQKLHELHRAGRDLSYNAMCRQLQSLVSAAAYHFGAYSKAVQKAGIEYESVTRRPRWTRQQIIRLLKDARRRGEDLHWSAVTRRGDELGKAAFASLQKRLFGSWDRALYAAGMDADDISRYRRWDRNSIIYELRALAREGSANSGYLQREDPGLHAAAIRHFGSYNAALRSAKLDPSRIRQRQSWNEQQVLRALKQRKRAGQSLSSSVVRHEAPPLYGAAIRLFGTFTAARSQAQRRARSRAGA